MIAVDNEENRAYAAHLLAHGQLVALPTETVYGLAADALNSNAVASIFETKNRPHFNPLIAHVSGVDMAQKYVEISPLAKKLMQYFWPGPLSFVLPLKKDGVLPKNVTAGLSSLALRCPQGVFADIIERVGHPLAAPSANTSGRISPTTAHAVEQDIGSKIPLILDGGACTVGVESTIIKIENENITLLRAGGVSREEVADIYGKQVLDVAFDAAISAPGMLKSHYAPSAKMRLESQNVSASEVLLAFGPQRIKGADEAKTIINLSAKGDLKEAATHLFSSLANLDSVLKHDNQAVIAVEPIPKTGIGEAINDRLKRAAADKE